VQVIRSKQSTAEIWLTQVLPVRHHFCTLFIGVFLNAQHTLFRYQ